MLSVGFSDWNEARRRLIKIASDDASRRALAECLPMLLTALSETATPDGSLVNFDRYVQSVSNRAELFQYLTENPRAVEILVKLFVGSQFLTEILLRNPSYLQQLTQHKCIAEFKSRPQFVEEAQQYAIENSGNLPSGSIDSVRALLLEGGYLNEWPEAPAFAYTNPIITVFDEFRYYEKYDDMDGNGARDSAISVQNLKVEVCEDFVRRYPSPSFGDTIYDYEAEGKRYPGETIGRHIKVFAITWSKVTLPDHCDLLWVVQYTGFPDQ